MDLTLSVRAERFSDLLSALGVATSCREPLPLREWEAAIKLIKAFPPSPWGEGGIEGG